MYNLLSQLRCQLIILKGPIPPSSQTFTYCPPRLPSRRRRRAVVAPSGLHSRNSCPYIGRHRYMGQKHLVGQSKRLLALRSRWLREEYHSLYYRPPLRVRWWLRRHDHLGRQFLLFAAIWGDETFQIHHSYDCIPPRSQMQTIRRCPESFWEARYYHTEPPDSTWWSPFRTVAGIWSCSTCRYINATALPHCHWRSRRNWWDRWFWLFAWPCWRYQS